MTGDENKGQVVFARHATGSVPNPEELNKEIAEAWAALIADPAKKAEIAKALGVSPDKIRADDPPYDATGGPAGIFGTTILIILAKGFLGGMAGAAGKATFDYLRSLWPQVAKPLEDPRTQALGAPVNPPTSSPAEGTTGPSSSEEGRKPGL